MAAALVPSSLRTYVRALARSPGFAAAALSTFALAIDLARVSSDCFDLFGVDEVAGPAPGVITMLATRLPARRTTQLHLEAVVGAPRTESRSWRTSR